MSDELLSADENDENAVKDQETSETLETIQKPDDLSLLTQKEQDVPLVSPSYGYNPATASQVTQNSEIRPVEPLSLKQALLRLPQLYWRIFTRPTSFPFVEEQNNAAWNIIWIQLLIFASIFALLNMLSSTLVYSSTNPDVESKLFALTIIFMGWLFRIGSYFAASIVIFLSSFSFRFFLLSGSIYLLARAFRGRGTFRAHCYCISLTTFLPMILVYLLMLAYILFPALFPFAPYVYLWLALVVFIYMLALQVYVTMGVHSHRVGKAIATLALSLIIDCLLFGLCIYSSLFLMLVMSNG